MKIKIKGKIYDACKDQYYSSNGCYRILINGELSNFKIHKRNVQVINTEYPNTFDNWLVWRERSYLRECGTKHLMRRSF